MSNDHIRVVEEVLKAIYDLGYQGYWTNLRQNGNEEFEITFRYKKKPDTAGKE